MVSAMCNIPQSVLFIRRKFSKRTPTSLLRGSAFNSHVREGSPFRVGCARAPRAAQSNTRSLCGRRRAACPCPLCFTFLLLVGGLGLLAAEVRAVRHIRMTNLADVPVVDAGAYAGGAAAAGGLELLAARAAFRARHILAPSGLALDLRCASAHKGVTTEGAGRGGAGRGGAPLADWCCRAGLGVMRG